MQRGQQEQAGAAEAGRHDAFGRLARVEHALAEHRVGGIPDAGRHGKGRRRRDRPTPPPSPASSRTPTAASAVAWAQRALSRSPLTSRPSTPGRGGPGADGDHGAHRDAGEPDGGEEGQLVDGDGRRHADQRRADPRAGARAGRAPRARAGARRGRSARRPRRPATAPGPIACAVPVVPKQMAARRTWRRAGMV